MSNPRDEVVLLSNPARAISELADVAHILPSGFEQNGTAYAAATIAVIGGVAAYHQFDRGRKTAAEIRDPESLSYLPVDYMRENAAAAVERSTRRNSVARVGATIALAGTFAHLAQPYIETTRSMVEDVAIVVATDIPSFARDIETADGEPIPRAQAAFNEVLNLDEQEGITLSQMEDVDISYILAGTQAEAVGVTVGGEGKLEVSQEAQAYVDQLQNRSEADFGGALALADQAGADKVLIFASDVPYENLPALRGQAEENEQKVSIIALGKSGTMVDNFGQEVVAPVNEAAHDAAVGAEDSYTATTTDELRETVSGIIGEQYLETERKDYSKFMTVAALSFGALALATYFRGVGGTISGAAASIRQRINPKKEQ